MSGNSLGVRRAEIKPGVREIHLCKDERGKTGLRLRAINKVGLAAWRERGWWTAPVSSLSRPSPAPSGLWLHSPAAGEGIAGWGWGRCRGCWEQGSPNSPSS